MKSFTKGIKVIAVFMFLLCQVVTSQVWEEIGINLPANESDCLYRPLPVWGNKAI